uniref:Uncharacterized protein n=1 Tax=Aegilops tauschii subsp. strangulata TaxID=200361 RepID=A0A452ZMG0_AEGTS
DDLAVAGMLFNTRVWSPLRCSVAIYMLLPLLDLLLRRSLKLNID